MRPVASQIDYTAKLVGSLPRNCAVVVCVLKLTTEPGDSPFFEKGFADIVNSA
jgi:hypothetical protein